VTGDLDLLISRSLDGDLPGEEERELRGLLAADPAARARYDAMARLVGRLEELPDPETPFALSTRVNTQVENDTKGFAASLQRYGFYFRPATLGVLAAGIATVAIVHSLRTPSAPPASVVAAKEAPAAAPADDGRVSVFFGESNPQAAPVAPRAAGPSAEAASTAARGPAPSSADAAKGRERPEPVLVASAEASRPKEEAYAPEPEPEPEAAAAAAPPAAAPRGAAEAESALEERAARKPAASVRLGVSAPPAAGAEIVGTAAGSLRLAAPASLEGLAGPFDGTYRLELDASGRVTGVARLPGGSGTEPVGLPERLETLSFAPGSAARTAGSVDVRVRIR